MEGSDTTPTGVTTDELLAQIVQNQENQRAEVAQLRAEMQQSKRSAPQPRVVDPVLNAEEAYAARMEEVDKHPFYCPSCGKLADYEQQCTGRLGTYPHVPTEVVSTDELKATNEDGSPDTSGHTSAPFVTGEGQIVLA